MPNLPKSYKYCIAYKIECLADQKIKLTYFEEKIFQLSFAKESYKE